MLRNLLLAALFCLWQSAAQAQNPPNLPFSLELEEITYPEWPALHSFAFGEWNGYWIIVAGKTNGLHGFFTATGFPENTANKMIWVLDPATGNKWSYNVTQLPSTLADLLTVTNPQYVQLGDKLYMIGGYGKENTSGNFITFNKLIAIDLPALVSAVQTGGNVQAAIRYTSDDRLRICGAEMHKLGDDLYLVGGHDFAGLYNSNGPPVFVQTYTSQIRRFRIVDTPNQLAISDYTFFNHEEYHRRDLNLAPLMLPGEVPALGAYGGVFKPNVDEPYFNPIYINSNTIEIDYGYEQKMSQYTCPIVPLYDEDLDHMYSIFFAGLSYHTFDEATQTFEADELVPFIDQITTFVRYANGTSEEIVLPQAFDELLGTNAKFVPNNEAPHYENEVFNLRAMNGATVVGHIFGGIKAAIPNITPSSSTNRLFRIKISPQLPNAAAEPAQANVARIWLSPNPFANSARIELSEWVELRKAAISDLSGNNMANCSGENTRQLLSQVETALMQLEAGAYLITLESAKQQHWVVKAVKVP